MDKYRSSRSYVGALILLMDVEISMSVLILLMSWYKLVTMSDPKQSLDLRRLNEASSLFSYRVIQSNSLVEAIEYELFLYSYC